MKPQITIPKLAQYCNNRLAPTDVREVQQWIQAHPQGDAVLRGVENLLQQENRNEARVTAFLQQKKSVLARKLFGKRQFG